MLFHLGPTMLTSVLSSLLKDDWKNDMYESSDINFVGCLCVCHVRVFLYIIYFFRIIHEVRVHVVLRSREGGGGGGGGEALLLNWIDLNPSMDK